MHWTQLSEHWTYDKDYRLLFIWVVKVSPLLNAHVHVTDYFSDTHLGRVMSQSIDVYSGSIIPFYSECLPYKHPQAGYEPGT